MVRLVFRPYTQVRKAICTSAHLRASTRVSSGFTLLRHSSPSFGSQQVCSHSNLLQKRMVGRWCTVLRVPTKVRLLALRGFVTHQLAYMLDSLVRVSRRAGWVPSASILTAQFQRTERHSNLGPRGGIDGGTSPAVIPTLEPMLTSI
jgi:hypothetical protein